MKKILIISFIIFWSCKDQKQKILHSNFNLYTDLTDYKNRISELDTLSIWFDHSNCTYEGYEKINITRESHTIKIRSEFMELTFNDNEKWDLMYENKIPLNDSLWNFEKFIERNLNRTTKTEGDRAIMRISNKRDTILFYTNGLVELNHYLEDYYNTMRVIHPENKNGIYGYESEEIRKE